ncbi:MAG TPA: alcohol dehydrogenase catalytic domain-containing protein [Gaiellaceae bacterium]|nr:alcohol dehydrogenase catalytic domain-containing protein [Gaiellaceae bacterium]
MAVCYVGNRELALRADERRAPGTDEVEIEVAYTGICGTDLHILHGAMDARVSLPAVLGHEMSGIVSRVGPGVEGIAAGDAVTVMPLDWCGACPACAAGNEHVCHNLDFLGIDSPGSMQSYWIAPARVVVPLPEGLSLEAAALAEPAAVAVHDVRRSDLLPGEQALVVGGGPIGLLIASVATAHGADVLVLEPNETRRQHARALGLRAEDPLAGDVQELIGEWTDGAGAPVAFEVSGAVAGLETAIQSLAVRGRLVVVAIHSAPPPVNLFRVFWRELTLIGARVYRREDFEHALELLASGAVSADRLVTSVRPLDQAAAAFEALEQGAELKVLLDCRNGAA